MKKNYVTPSIEIIEVEIEDAVLNSSDVNSLYTSDDPLEIFNEGGNAW